MENTFWTALATSTLAAIVTSAGIYTIRKFAGWGQRNTAYFMCFAAGVLISASFLHIIPKSLSMNANASIYLLAAAFTKPLGMIISYPIISEIDKPVLGALLSFSAGALIYVGATHLLPKAEQEHKRYSFVALGGGVLVAVIIVLSKA